MAHLHFCAHGWGGSAWVKLVTHFQTCNGLVIFLISVAFQGHALANILKLKVRRNQRRQGFTLQAKLKQRSPSQTHRGQWVLMQCYTSLIFLSRFLVHLHLQRCPSSHHPHDAKKTQFLAAPAKIRKKLTGSETSTTSYFPSASWEMDRHGSCPLSSNGFNFLMPGAYVWATGWTWSNSGRLGFCGIHACSYRTECEGGKILALHGFVQESVEESVREFVEDAAWFES